ncbi:MAG TPA: tautomerase family protein [Verrucomicrobiae bacterium]|nr:tautomerase family protein [Verrucomicrobiae bacterium]
MPSVLIETRRPYSADEETAIIEAVHLALRDAFKIPADDRMLRLVCHAPHRFVCPPDRQQPDRYVHITIEAFAGRSINAKRELYQNIAERLEPLGIPHDHVTVLLHEVARENWGHRGMAGSDIEVGFKIEV